MKKWMKLGETCDTSLHKSTITKPALTISWQVPFLVINSPNSLDRNVESSDLARSFLTSLILAPLSPGEFLATDLSTCVRGIICSLCAASETARSSRENFSREVMSVLSSTVSSSLEKLERMLICVLLSLNERETRFFLIKIEMSQERLETESKQSADLSQSFMLREDYVMCKLNFCSDKNRMLSCIYSKA